MISDQNIAVMLLQNTNLIYENEKLHILKVSYTITDAA